MIGQSTGLVATPGAERGLGPLQHPARIQIGLAVSNQEDRHSGQRSARAESTQPQGDLLWLEQEIDEDSQRLVTRSAQKVNPQGDENRITRGVRSEKDRWTRGFGERCGTDF